MKEYKVIRPCVGYLVNTLDVSLLSSGSIVGVLENQEDFSDSAIRLERKLGTMQGGAYYVVDVLGESQIRRLLIPLSEARENLLPL